MIDPPSKRYSSLVSGGAIEFDPAQARLAERLDRLAAAVEKLSGKSSGSPLARLFKRRRQAATKGIYIHGDVGRGKTMLVDLFFEAVNIPGKRRVHFNDFMAEVHERVHDFRQRLKRGETKGDDPIQPVAIAMAREAQLFCLDELHVDDIADAMILSRLFSALFARHHLILVATSNVPPEELYLHGLNRGLFLPFVGLLREHVDVVRLDASIDYRLDKLRSGATWFSPADGRADAAMDGVWRRLSGADTGTPVTLTVKGRALRVPQARMGVARFSFSALCEAPLGSHDFLAIARAFHTLLIDRIPVLRPNQRNEGRRFVLLIDTLYDNGVKLIASADAEPEALYPGGPLAGEFRRTASRLYEMRSGDYLAAPHGRHGYGRPAHLEPGCHSG